MSDFLTRDAILGIKDIDVKDITIPDHIAGWGGKKIYIRQLSRGKQDTYLKRQFGSLRMKQESNKRARKITNQELVAPDIYGHDAWLCVHSICDDMGVLLFTEKDMDVLNEKSGEAIGWIAQQILEYSGMTEDVDALTKAETDIKN